MLEESFEPLKDDGLLWENNGICRGRRDASVGDKGRDA